MADLKTFTMIQLRDVHPRNPLTGEVITEFLQWFAVTKDMSGDTIDPAKLTPRPDLVFGIRTPIPMSEIVKTDDQSLLRSLGIEPATVEKC